jgi:prefoldin subunit 5
MKNTNNTFGQIIGMVQNDSGMFARFVPVGELSEILIPVTSEQFANLPLNKTIEMLVPIKP